LPFGACGFESHPGHWDAACGVERWILVDVAPARKSLLDAATSRGKEDRLTEVFATVLDVHDELASALFIEVDLPLGERFQVLTQVTVVPGSRPDMTIHSLARNGAVVSRLWSEHKLEAGFGLRQRERYLAALRELEGQGELIFIVTDAPTAREEGDWRGFTWQEIGELVDRVGRDWGGHEWRTGALKADAPAKHRLLAELLWYLEDKELAVVHSFNRDNIFAYKLGSETMRALAALLERAAQNAAPLVPSDSGDEDVVTLWEQFQIPPGSWLERFTRYDVGVELIASDRDYWSPAQYDEPVLGAGYSFEGMLHPALSVRREWVEQLDAAGFSCELWADWVRVYKTMRMSEILEMGESLNAQARGLGTWIQAAILELGQLDPGELQLPKRSRRPIR
jgi:hypothetical protein